MLIAISTVILLILAFGLYKRHQPRVHIPVMLTAFGLDVGLVLYIELTRHAIQTAADSVTAPMAHPLLLFHIAVSLTTIILYVLLSKSGSEVYRGQTDKLKSHRNMAAVFIICRLTNYATSFFIIP